MAFGVFFEHGNQHARHLPRSGCGKDVIQYLLAPPFAPVRGVNDQKADPAIIGVGEAEGDFGNGNKLGAGQEKFKVKRGLGICAGGAPVKKSCVWVASGTWPESSRGSHNRRHGGTAL